MDMVGQLEQAKEWQQRMAQLIETHNQMKQQKIEENKEEDHSAEHAPSIEAAIIKPNLSSIRKILGGDGTDQQRKVVEENTGLIPKYYKPYKLLESTEHGRPVSLYRCDFCNQDYRGHNSIVYHCRRHIGDYPYRCEDCGFVEVCKSGLSSHMNRTGHVNCRKIDAQPMNNGTTTVASQNITQIRKCKHPLTLSSQASQHRSPSPADHKPSRKRHSDAKESASQAKKHTAASNLAQQTAFETTLSQLNNNDFKIGANGIHDFWKGHGNKVDVGKLASDNSWFLLGGRGVKVPPKRTSPRKPSPKKTTATSSSNSTDSSDIEEIVNPATATATTETTQQPSLHGESWKFCTKCHSAWFNLDDAFHLHSAACL